MKTDATLKYAYCPQDESKCYGTSVTNAFGELSGIFMTTVGFVLDDFCAFKIAPTDSDFYFMRYMNITIERAVDINCKMYYSEKIENLEEGIIDCSAVNATSWQFYSWQHIVIVV